MTEQTEQWVTMQDASKVLGVAPYKLSRLASKNRIKSKKDVLDERVRLVDLTELKSLFATSELKKREG